LHRQRARSRLTVTKSVFQGGGRTLFVTLNGVRTLRSAFRRTLLARRQVVAYVVLGDLGRGQPELGGERSDPLGDEPIGALAGLVDVDRVDAVVGDRGPVAEHSRRRAPAALHLRDELV